MGKFIWKDKVIVDFGDGVSFEIPDDEDSLKKRMGDVNDRLLKRVEGNQDNYTTVMNAVLDAIDELLGDGATGRLFKGHTLNARNVLNAYLFTVKEILSQSCECDDQVNDLVNELGKLGRTAVQLPTVSEEAKAAAAEKLAELGITPVSAPSKAEVALRPRL